MHSCSGPLKALYVSCSRGAVSGSDGPDSGGLASPGVGAGVAVPSGSGVAGVAGLSGADVSSSSAVPVGAGSCGAVATGDAVGVAAGSGGTLVSPLLQALRVRAMTSVPTMAIQRAGSRCVLIRVVLAPTGPARGW